MVQEARRAQAVAAMTVAGSGVAILPATLDRITKNGSELQFGGEACTITHVVAHSSRESEAVRQFLSVLNAK